jgi:hypothetical protein
MADARPGRRAITNQRIDAPRETGWGFLVSAHR